MIEVVLLNQEDMEELYRFEVENKDYFDSIGLGRPKNYFDKKLFSDAFEETLKEQASSMLFMHTIKADGKIVGRINLVGNDAYQREKELGFRVGKKHQGKGYGTQAVRLVIQAARDYGLHRITAGAAPSNIASQIVLIKNGFQFIGKSEKYKYLDGKWISSVLFELALTE